MTDNTAAIAKLQRVFGAMIDKDTLAAVLEVCGGNVDEAQKFLQDDAQGYDPRQLASVEGGIPKDYPAQAAANQRRVVAKDKDVKDDVRPASDVLEEQIKTLFLNEGVSLQEHLDSQNKHYDTYVSVLLLLLNQGVEISKASRPRIMAAAWSRTDRALPAYLMKKEELFGLPQILGALNLLDAGRKVRAIEKKLARLEKQGSVKPKKVGQLKSTINDLKREVHLGSVSGALSKLIRQWATEISSEKLEYYALNMPKGPWSELADMVHFNPKDFQCKWFLEYVFGKDAPQDSIINISKTLTSETLIDIISKHPIPYSYLRLNVKPLPEGAKPIIAKYATLDTVIWYYEELACPEVDEVLNQRLEKESPSFGYGKLMERLLYFKSIDAPFFTKLMPLAEERLRKINLSLESPVVILGDASNSMDVAIRVSTVISSVITCLSGAELKFFTGECVDPPLIPKNIPDVIELTNKMKANGLTAPAAGLWPYYEKKKVVKFFIVVTDEVENEKYKGWWFPTLFQKYHKEVYPAKIVFVSFLQNPSEKGRMVLALENMGIIPLQFKLDGKRPDLTKLDSLLGLLASESSMFPGQVKGLTAAYNKDKAGMAGVLAELDRPKEVVFAEIAAAEHGKEEVDAPKQEFKQKVKAEGEEPKMCVICEEAEVDTALLECGHMSFCQKCAEPLKECPMCRSAVVRRVRIYQNA